ncbi:MAG: response regulator [Pseudomonadota bacterium]
MPDKVLIFQDLIARFPSFVQEMERMGVGLLVAMDGGDALDKASTERPKVAILGVAMQGISGMECCRQLKKAEDNPDAPKVVLVTSSRSLVVKERAEEAGCDYLFSLSEPDTKLVEFVASFVTAAPDAVVRTGSAEPAPIPPQAPPEPKKEPDATPPAPNETSAGEPQAVRKVATRVDIPGDVIYIVNGKERNGWSTNASQTGVLFAVGEEYPPGTEMRLRFSLPDGSQFELPSSVVRVLRLKQPINDLTFGVAAKFGTMTAYQVDRLQRLMESRSLALAARYKPEFLATVFDQPEEIIGKALEEERIPPELDLYLEGTNSFERSAFTSDGAVPKCVRSLVGMRVQCTAFRVFLPSLKADPKTFGPTHLSILEKILEKTDSIETDVDALVRDAVLRGDDDTRQSLNDVSNRLYQARLKLLYAVDEMIRPDGLGPDEKEILRKAKARVAAVQALSATEPEAVKYNPRTRAAVLAAKSLGKEPAKGKSSARRGFRLTTEIRLGRPFILALAASIAAAFSLMQKPQADLKQLQIPIKFDRVEQVDDGLVIHMQLQTWKFAPRRNRDETLRRLEVFLLQNRLQQAEIRSQTEARMAALLSGEGDRGTVFARRIYIY